MIRFETTDVLTIIFRILVGILIYAGAFFMIQGIWSDPAIPFAGQALGSIAISALAVFLHHTFEMLRTEF